MKRISWIFAFLVLTFLGSCEDDENKSGSVIFWFDGETSHILLDDEAISLTYYVDNEIIGSSATSVYLNESPDCDRESLIKVTKSWEGDDDRTYTYKVIGNNDWEYWSGTVEFENDICMVIELEF